MKRKTKLFTAPEVVHQEPMVKEDETHISTKSDLQDLLQKQVCHEFDNERLYLAMALWCEEHGYTDTASFFSKHTYEERRHGMDFINFMSKQKMRVEAPCAKEVQRDYNDLKSLLEAAMQRERETSAMISNLHKEALKTHHLALTITGKYLQEQVEEEQLFESLLNLYDVCVGSKIDFEMGVNKIKDENKYKLGTL
jgi:ferritin